MITEHSKTLKIITSNIRFKNDHDESQHWDLRKIYLSKFFNDKDIDILGTQEGRRPQLLDLQSHLKNLEIIQSHRKWIEERMYPCIFIKSSRFKSLESGDVWLSETPKTPGSSSFNSAFPRLFTWTILEEKISMKKLFVVNVHLDQILSETRLSQINVLCQELKSKQVQNIPLIIMGDFNEGPSEEVRKSLLEHFSEIIDPWQELGKAEETSHHGFQGKTEGKRIDWILIDKRLKIESINLIKENHDGVYLSDHYPIMLTLGF